MKCPCCGKKVKSQMTFFGEQYRVRCVCGTWLLISPGIFKDKIVGWSSPEEQAKSLGLP